MDNQKYRHWSSSENGIFYLEIPSAGWYFESQNYTEQVAVLKRIFKCEIENNDQNNCRNAKNIFKSLILELDRVRVYCSENSHYHRHP